MNLSALPSENNWLYYDLENSENDISEILTNLKSGKVLKLWFQNGNGFEIKSTTNLEENIMSISYFWAKLDYNILWYLFNIFNRDLPNQENWKYKYGLSNFDNKIPGCVQLKSKWLNLSSIEYLIGVFKAFWMQNKILTKR